MKREPSPTMRAIRQERPFRSLAQETLVALLLAAERVRWPIQDALAAEGDLTLQQYNVLRILRGAGEAGLPTLAIGERMIERTPGITRLLDRLEKKKLVQRERSDTDRRQVVVRITRTGRELLARLDPVLDTLDDETLPLGQAELRALLPLLERIHAG